METEMKRRTFLKLSTAAIAAGVTASSFKDVDAAEWKKEIGKKGSQPDPVKINQERVPYEPRRMRDPGNFTDFDLC